MFTETWLNNSVPDCAIQLEQLTCYRADRALVEGGKRRGGGLCVYMVEFMIIKCRSFYLPREYTAILLVAVYIPPSSNNINRSEALHDLYQHISEQQTANPDAFLILAGDFNHADLKSVFQNTPTCRLPNKGKKYAGLCLHHSERSLQGPPPPPPRSLRPHHCHANACIQTAR